MPATDARRDSLLDRIYGINAETFDTVALEVWHYQVECNPLYRQFCDILGFTDDRVRAVNDIPFFPITMFRDHAIQSGTWAAERIFTSSGTTGARPGKHLIRDLAWYHRITSLCVGAHLRSPKEFIWAGLLPSYLERPDSSLVDMVQYFISEHETTAGGFFSKPDLSLIKQLKNWSAQRMPVILIGVSFALLDLFEQFDVPVWDELLVLETGGMKGRRLEITREELHATLRKHHPELRVGSEYGMTELLSQAYRLEGNFKAGPTMKILVRDISDPLGILGPGQRGALNIIDLANVDTCCFIATDDVGIAYEDGGFEVLGRLDQSEVRGCNLMYS